MTPEQQILLKNVALLVCFLAEGKASRLQADIQNDLCDGPDSARAEGTLANLRQEKLDKYWDLIIETRAMSHKVGL